MPIKRFFPIQKDFFPIIFVVHLTLILKTKSLCQIKWKVASMTAEKITVLLFSSIVILYPITFTTLDNLRENSQLKRNGIFPKLVEKRYVRPRLESSHCLDVTRELTFQPEVILECLGECVRPLVAQHRVQVRRDAPDPRHLVQIRLPVPQTVPPSLVMSLHGIMLRINNIYYHYYAASYSKMQKIQTIRRFIIMLLRTWHNAANK